VKPVSDKNISLMKQLLKGACVALLISSALFSCSDPYEDYSSNPLHQLAFSTDTLSFDTVLTTVNSPAMAFLVYNPNEKPLLISSVRLAGGAGSNFKINADGFAGEEFFDLEIRAKDSLYIFVDVRPRETGETAPTLIEDFVVFTTHGAVRQTVVLQAYGQDVYKSQSLILDKDTVLSNHKPYLIYDSLVVAEGVTAEIGEGTVFYMGNNAQVIIYGTLKIRGTVEKPVAFRGSRTDRMLVYPYELLPGQWEGLYFDSLSYGNDFENVKIRNGRYGMYFAASDPEKEKITLHNVTLTNAAGVLLHAENCRITAANCEFTNAKDCLLNLYGGSYYFTHCTIANYYPQVSAETGWGTGNGRTLFLTDKSFAEGESSTRPVLAFEAVNSIIAANKAATETEIDLSQESARPLLFQNCVFTGKPADKSYIHYENCLTEAHADSLFRKTDCRGEDNIFWPEYDFRPQERSPARDAANIAAAEKYPEDAAGNSRTADGTPDAGAYEYRAEEPVTQ
jgi:hypothetical protein